MTRARLSQYARYAAQGLAALGSYLMLGHGLHALGAPLGLAGAVAFLGAIATNYVLQKRWVFADSRPFGESLPKFLLVTGVGFLINTLMLSALVPHISLTLGQLIVAGVIVVWNAVLAYLWVFAVPTRGRS